MEGYRSRDWDGVKFVKSGEAPAPGTGRMTRVIEAGQLLVIGDLDIEGTEPQPDRPGEWGRIGPAPRTGRRLPPAGDPFGGANEPTNDTKE